MSINKKSNDVPTKQEPSSNFIDRIAQFKHSSNLAFLFCLALCFIIGFSARKGQLEAWQKNKAAYYANNEPLMTTLDAPFFIDLAKNYKTQENKRTRGYPANRLEQKFIRLDQERKILDNPSDEAIKLALAKGHIKTKSEFKAYYQKRVKTLKSQITQALAQENKVKNKASSIPLLSVLIAKISPWFGGQNYLTGTYIVIIAASLFVIPLGIYFWLLGLPLAGLLGALVGNFSIMYYLRSSIGRIDTDMLNLFFPFLLSLLILMITRVKEFWQRLAFTALTALTMNLFMWWYAKNLFILAFGLTLIASLLALPKTRKWQTVLSLSLLYFAITLPFNHGISNNLIYFFKQNLFQSNAEVNAVVSTQSNPAIFPNTIKTISEAQGSFSIAEALNYTISNKFLAYLGLLSFLAMGFFYWKQLIPLAPIILLGIMSFKGSNRMIMFLSPFIGIGLGYLLTLALEQIKDFTWFNIKIRNPSKILVQKKNFLWTSLSLSCAFIFFFFIKNYTYINYIPRPSMPSKIMKSFKEIKKAIPENSAILTWWDYGYAITEQTNLSIFHDGGGQFSPKTHFIAKSLVSPKQNYLFKTTKFLSTQGNMGIGHHRNSASKLLDVMSDSPYNTFNPIYLLFTYDMIGKYGALSRLGNWDIKTGTQKAIGAYKKIACNRIQGKTLFCGRYVIDLAKGILNKRIPLKRIVQVISGHVLKEQNFNKQASLTLQILLDKKKRSYEFQLLNEKVYQSNFNQMYILGRYDKNLFEETYSTFPLTRVFKFKFRQNPNYAYVYKPGFLKTL